LAGSDHYLIMKKIVLTTSLFVLAACVPQQAEPPADFFNNLSKLCGKSFAGKVISSDPQDADWAKETLVMHVRGP